MVIMATATVDIFFPAMAADDVQVVGEHSEDGRWLRNSLVTPVDHDGQEGIGRRPRAGSGMGAARVSELVFTAYIRRLLTPTARR